MPAAWVEGSITMDGTEQTLVEVTTARSVDGYLDLSPMQNGDEIVIRLYGKIKSDGEYRLYDDAKIAGAQPKPLFYIHRRPTRYGWKITIQQTAGTYRTFDYQFVLTLV